MNIDDKIFSFEDFIYGNTSKTEKSLDNTKVNESTIQSEIEQISVNQIEDINKVDETSSSDVSDIPDVQNQYDDHSYDKSIDEEIVENFYPLYKDKGENFQCDIYVEGVKTDETIVRLIVESQDWTLMFPGEIKNGRVNIPIKKLSILEEGQVGKVKLEVIAEGTLFIPWEDQFKVKLSKKVSVQVNGHKNQMISNTNKPSVKVSLKK